MKMSETDIQDRRAAEGGITSPVTPVIPFPGEKVSILDVVLPDAITGDSRLQAARVHVSDRLACPDDKTVILPLREVEHQKAWQRVLVIDRENLHQFIQQSGSGLPVLPDFLTLPYRDDVVTVSKGATPQYTSFRIGVAYGLTVRDEIADACFSEVLAKTNGVSAICVTADATEQMLAMAENSNLPLADPSSMIQPDKFLFKLQDIRSAEKSGRPKWLDLLNSFSFVLFLSFLTLLITSAGMYWRANQLEQARIRMHQDIDALVRKELLPSGPILDLRRQVTAALQAQSNRNFDQSNGRPAHLLSLASKPLSKEGININRLAWSNTEGLILTVNLESFELLEVLTSDLVGGDLLVEVVDSNVSSTQGVTATVATNFRTRGAN